MTSSSRPQADIVEQVPSTEVIIPYFICVIVRAKPSKYSAPHPLRYSENVDTNPFSTRAKKLYFFLIYISPLYKIFNNNIQSNPGF